MIRKFDNIYIIRISKYQKISIIKTVTTDKILFQYFAQLLISLAIDFTFEFDWLKD